MFKAAIKLVGVSTIILGFGMTLNSPVEAKRYRLMCQGDHFHYGSSSGHRSRSKAYRAAAKDWAGFTAFEYGAHYARWKLSKSKRVSCTRATGSWGCSVSSTPCRRS